MHVLVISDSRVAKEEDEAEEIWGLNNVVEISINWKMGDGDHDKNKDRDIF